jgi:hypothetical protein
MQSKTKKKSEEETVGIDVSALRLLSRQVWDVWERLHKQTVIYTSTATQSHGPIYSELSRAINLAGDSLPGFQS